MDINKKNAHSLRNLIKNDPDKIDSICKNYFNFSIKEVENEIQPNSENTETYEGENLEEMALNTSWFDYYQMLSHLVDKNLKMIDIGSSYSKGTILSNALGLSNITSIEVVEKRVQYTREILNKCDVEATNVFLENALNHNYDSYDIFFIYQPVGKFLSSLLELLSKQRGKKIWIIESHGDLIPRIDIDNRFSNKRKLFDLKSQRHTPELYEYTIQSNEKCELMNFESSFYKAKSCLIKTKIMNFGEIEWFSSLEENSFLDYIDGNLNININNRRFSFDHPEEQILCFNPELSEIQRLYTKKKTVNYNGIDQRILKHIISPKGHVELSTSGIVKLI